MAVSNSKKISISIGKERCVDKEWLAKAVSLHKKDLLLDFAWGMQLPEATLFNSAVNIDKVRYIPVPVSLKDIDVLKVVSEEVPCGRGCNVSLDVPARLTKQIGAEKVHFITLTKTDIWSAIGCHLGLPINAIDVEIKLDKLVLYETGGDYKQKIINSKQFGTFATVALQLPVEGGHEGGGFKVEYNERRKIIETHQNSDKRYYLLSYYNCCEKSIEPVTKGSMLMLVFNLIWKNLKTELPHNFPVFLHSLNEIKESLKPWIPHPRSNIKEKLMNDLLNTPSKIDPAKIGSYPEDKESHLSLYSEKTLMNDVLFFVLEEQYGEKDVPFHRLRGNDLILAQLLLHCPFIDVHIATVTHKRFQLLNKIKSDDWLQNVAEKNPTITISSWKDSENVSRDYDIKLDQDHQCVGPIRNLTTFDTADRIEVVSFGVGKCEVEIEEKYFFRRVLVIWPKEESFRISCSFGLNSVLDRMENSLNLSIPKLKEDVRQSLTQDLKNLISFGCIEPLKLWARSGMEKGEFTLRLLRLCIRLEAREEGLALLKLLGSDFAEDSQEGIGNDTENFEGIKTEQVALAIAEFQCLVDWSDIAELIKQMISPHRITQQFITTLSLAKYLLEVNCAERAKEVGNFITSAFANIDQHLDTCVSCYIRLGNAEWLQALISDIFHAQVIVSEANLSKKFFLGVLISSPVIWELVTSSELSKPTMNMLLSHQLTLLLDELSSTLHIRKRKTVQNEAFLSELSSCLKFVGRLERDSYVVDSKHMSMVQLLLEKVGIQQLLDLLIELLKCNDQPSTVGILRFLCKSLVSRMKAENVPAMLGRESILEAIKRLNQSEDKLLLRSFLEQVNSYEITGSWDHKFKLELFDALFYSSGIWDGLDSTSKLIVLDTCTTLVSVWIVHICRILDSSSLVTKEVLNSEIFGCVKLFFLAEKNRFGLMTDNASVLQHLLSKLSLPQLLQLILDLYVSESKSKVNIKKSPTCLVWYRDLCRLVFSRDFTSFVKKDQVDNVFLCLLWLKDDQLWELFSSKSVEIQQGLVGSSSAFIAFARIVEGWTEQSNSWKEPKFTWKQPTAVVNGHPELQAFLRSPLKSMIYQYFTSVTEARRFADKLLEESKHLSGIDGFNIVVSPIGEKSAHCSIAKNLRYHVNIHQNVLKAYRSFKEKFDQFLELWLNLSKDRIVSDVEIEQSGENDSTTEDEIVIISPTKRFRSEIDVVDLSV